MVRIKSKAMPQFELNEEFFDTVKHLIDGWCDERRLRPLAVLLPNYVAFNGMKDGWFELYAALRNLLSLGSENYTPLEWETVNDLIHAADRVVHPRQIPD